MMIRMRRHVLVAGYALVVLSLPGCAILDRFASRRTEGPGGSDQELMSRAEASIARKRYDEGRKNLQRLINQFPESELVPTARLSVGRSYYNEKRYEEARAEYQRFIELFPQHERVDEARYYTGLSFFRQMEKADRDQSLSKKAVAEFQVLLSESKDSQYAADARAKLIQCRRQLAEKELYVGKFYFDRGSYGAAIKRFEAILKEYAGSGYDDQALYYLGESLWELEQRGAAKAAFERLVSQFPDSDMALPGAKRIGVPLTQNPRNRKPVPGFFSTMLATMTDTFSELRDAILDSDVWQSWSP
ncbi:MAG: outer membrane protein assembly factor BamD [Acidobacteria bacterium]|nr:outer membrane protein assembly factor BamD [Acidobacteriota bacterium]